MNRTTVGPNPAEAEEQTGLVTVLRWSWRLSSSDRRWRRRMLDCSFKTSLQHKTGWTSDWRERRPRSRGTWGCVFHWFSGFSARLVFVHSGCKTPAGNFITDTNKQTVEVSHRAEAECWSRCWRNISSTSDPVHCFIHISKHLILWQKRVWGWRQKHEVYKTKSHVFSLHTSVRTKLQR